MRLTRAPIALALLLAACAGTQAGSPSPSASLLPTVRPTPTAGPTATPLPLSITGSAATCASYIAASPADRQLWVVGTGLNYAPDLEPALVPQFAEALLSQCNQTVALDTVASIALGLANDPRFAKPTPAPTPVSYAKLTSREWAQLVKAPDTYLGKAYQVWGCITQFDAATGQGAFRAQAAYAKVAYWYTDGQNTFFTGDAAALAPFVANDVVAMNVISTGSYSYNTQSGGNTTVPSFQVDKITASGSC